MVKSMEQTSRSVKTLCWLFELECNPIWIVTPEGGKRSTLDDELYEDDVLWDVLVPLYNEFETTCFTPNMDVLGFPSDEAMEAFNAKLKAAYEFVKEHLKGRYEVEEPIYFKDRIKDVY